MTTKGELIINHNGAAYNFKFGVYAAQLVEKQAKKEFEANSILELSHFTLVPLTLMCGFNSHASNKGKEIDFEMTCNLIDELGEEKTGEAWEVATDALGFYLRMQKVPQETVQMLLNPAKALNEANQVG